MVISYIHSICWHMKSVFYEHQHLAQKIVASSVFLVIKILAIEDNKLYGTFLHVAFR
jgi:hypothetical protein